MVIATITSVRQCPVSPLRGSARLKKKSFNIYVREKRSKQNMCILRT